MNHQNAMRNEVVRLFYSVIVFLVFVTAGVALDLLSQRVRLLGVSDFTYYVVSLTAHFMLILDVILFSISLLFSAWEFLRGIAK